MPGVTAGDRWLRVLTNGWGLTGIVTWANGQPFTAISGQDNSRSGVNLDRADLVPEVSQDLPSGRPRAQVLGQYFNTAAFRENALGTFGDAFAKFAAQTELLQRRRWIAPYVCDHRPVAP